MFVTPTKSNDNSASNASYSPKPKYNYVEHLIHQIKTRTEPADLNEFRARCSQFTCAVMKYTPKLDELYQTLQTETATYHLCPANSTQAIRQMYLISKINAEIRAIESKMHELCPKIRHYTVSSVGSITITDGDGNIVGKSLDHFNNLANPCRVCGYCGGLSTKNAQIRHDYVHGMSQAQCEYMYEC